jgi:phospholipid transport system substrate-binding protein
MLRQATGRHWKSLSGKQKKELLDMYTKWSIATYAARFNGYSGERFEVVPQAGPARGTVSVVSKLIKSNGEEIEFDYQLQKREGSWKVVDILIKGVSQLAMTRAQFVDLLDKKGYDGLLSSLKEKIADFSKKKE